VNILLIMVPLGVAFIALAIGIFVWAVRRGQYDDLETPALDILVDDLPAPVAPPAALEVDGTGESAGRDAD